MERLQVQLPREWAERLRELARRRGGSLAALVREAVGQTLKDPLRAETMEERRRRSLSVVGRYRSGSREPVSAEHDRYLDEIYGS